MSTILEALKKLERDKQFEQARHRAHDPLAPAPEPAMASVSEASRGPGIWLVAGGVALMFAAGIGIGLYTASTDDAPVPVAARDGDADVLAAPARPRFDRSAPIAGIEPVVEPPPLPAAPARPLARLAGAPPRTAASVTAGTAQTAGTAHATGIAQAGTVGATGTAPAGRPPVHDPWEEAATAAAGEREEPARESERPVSPAPAPAPTVAAGEPAPPPAAAPGSVGAGPPAAAEGGIAIDTLPVVDLPLEPPLESAPEPVLARSSVEAESSAEPAEEATSARPGLADVVVPEPDERLEVKVLKTVWHPKPERRWARLEVAGREGAIEVRESDDIEGYRIEEITPSTVVLSRGTVTVTHRVGR